MNTKQKDEPVQTSTQRTPVSGGNFVGREKRKRILKKILPAALAPVLIVGGILTYLLLTVEKRPEDPLPEAPLSDLSQEEVAQRLHARFDMKIEVVKRNGVDTSKIKKFEDAMYITEILSRHDMWRDVFRVYGWAEENGKADNLTANFYIGYATAAYRSKNTPEGDRLVNRALEKINSDASLNEGEKSSAAEWIKSRQPGWRFISKEEVGD